MSTPLGVNYGRCVSNISEDPERPKVCLVPQVAQAHCGFSLLEMRQEQDEAANQKVTVTQKVSNISSKPGLTAKQLSFKLW